MKVIQPSYNCLTINILILITITTLIFLVVHCSILQYWYSFKIKLTFKEYFSVSIITIQLKMILHSIILHFYFTFLLYSFKLFIHVLIYFFHFSKNHFYVIWLYNVVFILWFFTSFIRLLWIHLPSNICILFFIETITQYLFNSYSM